MQYFLIKLSGSCRLNFPLDSILKGKPRVSLTAPNRNHFLPASLTVSGAFSSARAKAKKLIRESIAQDLVQI